MTDFERREADWLSVDEAVRRILAVAPPMYVESIPLELADGRALAHDLTARATLPPFDNSAMDGYAVRAEDVRGASEGAPRRLRVTGEIRAGDLPERTVEAGEAVRIMTGAPLPGGADCVIRVEHTDAEEAEAGRVTIHRDDDAGRHVRAAGRDMEEGDVVLRSGTAVTPGVVALVAALGLERVDVVRTPKVGVLSSGEELRGPDGFEDVRAGRGVPDTNGPSLAAAIRSAGAEPVRLGIARDDPDDIRERVSRAMECDALVTSGGASMGEADLFKRALHELGLEVDFWRVKIRPGSPFSLAHLPRPGGPPLPVLGLPGNPASSFVTFQILVRPLLLAMAGHRRVHRRTVRAVAGETLSSTPRLTHFHRVVLDEPDGDGDGGRTGSLPRARLAGPQSSGLVSSLARADGLAVVPEGVAALEPGEELDVVLLDDGPGARAAPPGFLHDRRRREEGGAA